MKIKHPVAIVTQGSLVKRDIELLSYRAGDRLTRVGISVTTLNASSAGKLKQRASSPKRRMMMIERLSKAGIHVSILASPLIPGLTDHEMEGILEAGKDAGTKSASWTSLHLPGEVSELTQDWLDRHALNRKSACLIVFKNLRGVHFILRNGSSVCGARCIR